MSTRRARIKAVTSLPPRRKNNNVTDNNKVQILEKETTEKPIRSPKTPRGSNKTQDNIDRQSPKPSSPLLSPRHVNNIFNQYQARSTPSPLAQTEVIKDVTVTPKSSEKVSVITSVNSVKPNNVFVSPRNVGSPLRKRFESPHLHNSKVDLGVQRLTPVTPEKVHEKPKEKSVETQVEVEVSNGKSKEITKDVVSTVSTDVPDDYSVPSVPESINEDTVMDGIVPLQKVSIAPKPLALLKNEIISENAEVLFDPIVPLPSPSKVRPKLRPVPRLAPMRRNSVQGSASESEDESRRALLSSGGANRPAPPRQRHDSHTSFSTMHSLPNREGNRNRNDSVCSSVSQATTQPPTGTSPVKEKHFSKSRRQDMSRRMAAMRRRRETVKKETLTMYDLIFYNPSSNPIIPDKDEVEAQQANEKEEAARKAAAKDVEENVDDPPETANDAAPVPQIKLGPNGEIMLDEQSLVIKQSDKRKVSSNVVHEGSWGTGSTSGRYRRTPRTADWSDAETVRFYRALATLGTDFMLMESLFPGRTRRDLKLKFKKEERINMAQVDKALRSTCKWDATRLGEEFQTEREEADKAARAEAQELQQRAIDQRRRQKEARELRVRLSRGSKALGASTFPSSNTGLTADELILRHREAKASGAKVTKPKAKRGRPKSTAYAKLANIAPKPTTTASNNKATDMATLRKVEAKPQDQTPEKQPQPTTPVVPLPPNIENGSLVVLTVNDPKSPSKKMLQTYISGDGGRLTPVALPASFLNTVVTYMKNGGTPKSTAGSSPHLASPCSVASQDSRPPSTPGVIQMGNSPRKRHSSYTITQL